VSDLDWASMVTVGRIIRPHGRRGEVVVESETDFPTDRFVPGARLFWMRPSAGVLPAEIRSSRPYDARWVVGLEGIGTIDEAEQVRGLELRIPAAELRPLGTGTYYVHDLVGCRVETTAGTPVGDVREVQFGSGAPLLVVEGTDGEVLVPMTAHICLTIDVMGRVVVIEPPPGLLELNRRTPKP
jgi:16S rRNA processing protein RimM